MKEENRETNISFRIDKTTKDKIQKFADADGRTLANYLRWILHRLIEKGGKL